MSQFCFKEKKAQKGKDCVWKSWSGGKKAMTTTGTNNTERCWILTPYDHPDVMEHEESNTVCNMVKSMVHSILTKVRHLVTLEQRDFCSGMATDLLEKVALCHLFCDARAVRSMRVCKAFYVAYMEAEKEFSREASQFTVLMHFARPSYGTQHSKISVTVHNIVNERNRLMANHIIPPESTQDIYHKEKQRLRFRGVIQTTKRKGRYFDSEEVWGNL